MPLSIPRRRICLVLGASLLASASVNLHAQTTVPRYRGTAWLANVQKGVAIVTATLNVTIQDQTGAKITNPSAAVTLPNLRSQPPLRMSPITPPANSVASFQLPVSMTLLEYSQWQLGLPPTATLLYTDASGKNVQVQIVLNLVRLPAGVSQ
ncbi:hypothetical protein PTE30175_01107 [Pandoraea terrae]|uniref:Uncharacterized protein n=1 Tax=Pandoraea terrae TaxID=1537710 RepID=A0A5E4T261_9BURK|nr:hypothetical protein [Pandoraea terrae]VVD81885.1 hypothetical protein PTE30175_01107 [Pandoraea terrae]